DGSVELANPAFVRLLGFRTFDEMSGVRLHPPEELFAHGSSGRVDGCERKLLRANGSHVFVRESGRLTPGLAGQIGVYEGVVEDITASRSARRFEQGCRDLLERVARNERLSDLLTRL